MAEKVLFLGLSLLSISHFLFTVNKATEVRLLASIALVERAAMIGELLRLTKVNITFCSQPFIAENPLLLCVFKRLTFDPLLETYKRTEFFGDRF